MAPPRALTPRHLHIVANAKRNGSMYEPSFQNGCLSHFPLSIMMGGH